MSYSKEQIEGMVIILNKLFWHTGEYDPLLDANDLPKLNGKFILINDEIQFKEVKK
ncbi:MAG: hypothetical protein PHX80_05705 [Candidatus Nanoarchaeia archaeon]|nr:hypothetical protein [Candidatus Nanoarchaeia archaeon]